MSEKIQSSSAGTSVQTEPSEKTSAARPKSRPGRLFITVLTCVILVLSAMATQISSRIVISQNWQRVQLTSLFADQLQDNAIFRARSLDPEAKWLKTDEEATSQIRSYIEENLASTIRLNGDELSKDSNLAWIINYKGREYQHNWKDSYDQERGALDYTIQSSADGTVTYSGAIQPGASFSRELSILVNPSIVPTERLNSSKGSEYSYQLVLPDDFSIRYYIPSIIKPNGGTIAKEAYRFDTRNIRFCMMAGTGILLVLIVLWRWEVEKELSILKRFRKLRALPAFLALGLSTYLCSLAVQSLCSMNADGTLTLLLQSFGMSAMQAKMGSFLACFSLWTLFFCIICLWILYLKSIFAEGLIRYLREDTVISALFQRGQREIIESFSSPANTRTAMKLLLTGFGVIVIFAILLLGGYHFYSVQGLLLGFLIGMLLMAGFVWGVYRRINESFAKVYAASEQLAKGNFSALKPEDIGFYQPLYEELIHISESYQSALKEGLASQITKTQLISNVSHDLKTPVAGIQSYSELITLSDNMDDIHEYAKRLSNYSIRLSDLIADLFDVAKATSGDITLKPIDLDLSELVMQVGAEWDDQFEARKLRPVYNLQPGTMLNLDPGLTVRIMENLLSNICKYSLENSRVFIDLRAENGLYQLVLKNTSKTEMSFTPEQIVERFTRGDASRHESGSGLGLAIVKSFVEVQQGTFEVKTDGDLFKACISFAIPPKPDQPHPGLPKPPVQSPASLSASSEKTEKKDTILKASKPEPPASSAAGAAEIPSKEDKDLSAASAQKEAEPKAAEKKEDSFSALHTESAVSFQQHSPVELDDLPPIDARIHNDGKAGSSSEDTAEQRAEPSGQTELDPLFAASLKSAATAFEAESASVTLQPETASDRSESISLPAHVENPDLPVEAEDEAES